MIWQQIRVAVLAGGILAATALTARAQDSKPAAAPMPSLKPAPTAATPAPAMAAPAPMASDCCGPQYRTVCVNEWVPETYEKTITVMKKECVQEKYTAYRCESVPETRQRTCTVYEKVPEVVERVRHICVKVPVVEERTTMEKHWVSVPECKVVRKCVDKGHYECKEVPCGPSMHEKMHKWLHKDCCEECCEPCPKTKTVKVWVPCPTWEEHTVTCMKKVCEMRPVTCKVTVCKTEMKEEKYSVTVCKTVAKQVVENYTVCVTKQIPYEATRTVVHCVPVQEKVTCTRMVCHKVEKQVPVATCCEDACGKESWFHKMSGRFHHKADCGCSSCGCN
jgi:hypothetical protein